MNIKKVTGATILATSLLLPTTFSSYAKATEEINFTYEVNLSKAEEKKENPSVDEKKVEEQAKVNSESSIPKSVMNTATTNSSAPVNSQATKPSEAGGTIVSKSNDKSKQFYTIKSVSGKTFYLIAEPDAAEAKFVTEVSEQDLLNLIKTKGANNFAESNGQEKPKEEPKKQETNNQNSSTSYVIYGILFMIMAVGIFIFKKLRSKKDKEEDFQEDLYEEYDTEENVEEDNYNEK